jgi:hypothetical protein
MKMNRTITIAAAVLLLAGAAYPLLALDSKKTTEPVKAVEMKDESKTLEVKPGEPLPTDAPVTDPVATEVKEEKSIEPMAKDTTTTEPVVTETKPAVPTPSNPSATNNVVTDTATGTVKDKVMDAAKDKAVDAATSTTTTTSDAAAPAVK